jgi:hypothetical protein
VGLLYFRRQLIGAESARAAGSLFQDSCVAPEWFFVGRLGLVNVEALPNLLFDRSLHQLHNQYFGRFFFILIVI